MIRVLVTLLSVGVTMWFSIMNNISTLIKNRFKIINVKQDFIFPYKIKPYLKGKYEMIEHFKVMPKKFLTY